MNATRLITVSVFIATVIGVVVLVRADSLIGQITGAALFAAAALVLSRHFWREGDKRTKRQERAIAGFVSSGTHQITSSLDASNERMSAEIERLSGRMDGFTRGVLEHITQLELDLAKSIARVNSQMKDDRTRLGREFKTMDRRAIRYRDDAVGQLSGVVGVYWTLKPSIPYPPFGGYAIGGDCAQRLVAAVLRRAPHRIIEVGSGLSTVLMAQALELIGGEGHVISLEHDEHWLEESNALLAEHGMTHRAQILHTPLVETKVGDEVFLWYDISSAPLPERAEIIFVDGPPQSTGALARYPALPMLYGHLSEGGMLLLDDAHRQDEREAVDRWESEFPGLTISLYKDSRGTAEIIKASHP